MIKAKFTLFVAGLTLLATAVGQSDWTSISSKDNFLTMQFPPGWTAINQDQATFEQTIEQLQKNNPKMANLLTKSANKDLALQVFDLNDDPTDGGDNMSVQITKNPGITDKDLGAMGKPLLEQMKLQGKKEAKVVNLPFGKALNYFGDLPLKMDGGLTLNMQIFGYLYLKGDKMIVVTFATTNGKLEKLRPTFEKIVKSTKHS